MKSKKEKLPGSNGEHTLQKKYKSQESAKKFYKREVFSYITPEMQKFIDTQSMLFIATSDANGECDSSFRHGEQGFIRVINKHTIIYPEFRGNGVMASLGNISENGHIGLLFIDFFETKMGLHVNGKASIIEKDEIDKYLQEDVSKNIQTITWIVIEVEEAYIHCSKNIPHFSYNNPIKK